LFQGVNVNESYGEISSLEFIELEQIIGLQLQHAAAFLRPTSAGSLRSIDSHTIFNVS